MLDAVHYEKVLNTTDSIVKSSTRVVQPQYIDIIEKHNWWLREADRHATGGFYDGGEFIALKMFGQTTLNDQTQIGKAERHLENIIAKKRLIELYGLVEGASLDNFGSSLDLSALIDGTYETIKTQLGEITSSAGIDSTALFSTDILLPRSIMQMNYPFSAQRSLKLPPAPDDLRVLFDFSIDFDKCFDFDYLNELKHCGGRGGRSIQVEFKGKYMKHSGASNPAENWVMDVAYNHFIQVYTTFNGNQGTVDFVVRQKNMHKKFWHYKARDVVNFFGGKSPLLHDPRELYNASRRAIRRTHSYLQKLAKEHGVAYRTFPQTINP